MQKQTQHYSTKNTLLPGLGLFASVGTLVCCALPALFVTLGAGATLASLLSTAPWLVALSQYKMWTFGVSALCIVLAGIMQWNTRNAPCPIDPQQAKACKQLRSINRWIYRLSVAIWCIGFFFAFIAVHLFY